MSGYSRKSLQIVGGSLQMNVPADKTPQTELILAQNWRTDSLGRLVSRAGYPARFTIPGAGIAHSAANAGGVSSPLYVGTNSGIVNPTSSVYYDGAQIATGFDGRRIAFAFENGFAWIMNRGKQGRHSPDAGWEDWTLSPPPASVTLAAVAPPATVATVTYTYPVDPDPDFIHSLTIAGVVYAWTERDAQGRNALVASLLAQNDPNASVTYSGSGNDVVITPIPADILIAVSGSDGNADTNLSNGGVPPGNLPNGTYQIYITFSSADDTLESNPGPVSDPITVALQAIAISIPAADAPVDPRIGFVNFYATGGTLGSAYRVGRVASTVAAPATTFTYTLPDLEATNNGIVMPIDHDPPPAASGIIGPFFSRLYAWSTALKKNRLFWTDPNLPQYFPGSNDPQVGNWVDVGADDEEIVWVTLHTNLIVIYKERSIWMILGTDPSTETLQQVEDGMGLSGQWAVIAAGLIDYFVGPNGLYLFDMDKVHAIAGAILPIFNQSRFNAGALTPPGSILPGTSFNSTSMASYAVALGHAGGKLYLAYAEFGTVGWNLLVYNEGAEPERGMLINAQPGKWFNHRNNIPGLFGFFGFFFDGLAMIGLSGQADGSAWGLNLDDFRGFLNSDAGGVPIRYVYQSHYENCGLPENDKMWLEVAVDFELGDALVGKVYAAFNNGNIAPVLLGALGTGGRRTVHFAMPESEDAGILALNMSVLIDVSGLGPVTIHNVYLYYYVEARLAVVASTISTDLGVAKNKECKEIELDIDATLGAVACTIVSDLPGNALEIRQSPQVAKGGRAPLRYPFPVTQGFLWQVSLVGGPFRLYSVRMLMRVLGVFVEGYESLGGFRWDSMQIALGDGEVSTLDQLRFEMDAQGASSVELFTDLPGETSISKGVFALTAAVTTRAWVTVPLPEGIEGRSVEVQVTGNSGYRLYRAQVRHNRIGRFLMGKAPDQLNDEFRTLEFDFASERIRMYKRIEFDLRADGTVNVEVITNQDGDRIAPIYSPAISTPNGRSTVLVAMPPGVRGRLLRIRLWSTQPARIYKIRVWTRPVNEAKAGWEWAEFPMESSTVVPTWVDLIVEETSPTWQWVDVPFDVSDTPGAPE